MRLRNTILLFLIAFLSFSLHAQANGNGVDSGTSSYAIARTNKANTYTLPQTAPAFFPQTITAGGMYNYFNDFNYGGFFSASQFGTATTAGSYAASTTVQDLNHPTDWKILSGFNTGATNVGEYIVLNGGAQSFANPSIETNPWIFDTAVYVPVLPATTAGSYNVGLVHTNTENPWTSGTNFTLSSLNGVANDWYCQYETTQTDSGVAATAAWVRLSIMSDGTNVHWYINGTQVCTPIAITNLAAVTQGINFMSVAGQESTSMALYVDYVSLQIQVTR